MREIVVPFIGSAFSFFLDGMVEMARIMFD
jgi:hypothetical protein